MGWLEAPLRLEEVLLCWVSVWWLLLATCAGSKASQVVLSFSSCVLPSLSCFEYNNPERREWRDETCFGVMPERKGREAVGVATAFIWKDDRAWHVGGVAWAWR